MKNKKIAPVLAVVLLIAVIVLFMVCSSILKKYMPTKEVEDLNDYYALTSEEQMAVIKDNTVLEAKGICVDGKAYLDYNTVHDALNERFYWDANENVLLYTTPTDLVTVNAGENRYFVTKAENATDYTIARVDGDTLYVAIDFVQQYTNMAYTYFESPNRVVITTAAGDKEVTAAKKDTEIREKGGIKSPILKQVKKGENLAVIETGDTWSKVASEDGVVGYVKTKFFGDTETVTAASVTNGYTEEFTHIKKDAAINMGWHQVTNMDANGKIASVLSATKGMNVISPTWFYLNDSNGDVASLASLDYVNYCHQNGMEVWGLISNLENPDASSTEVLTHTSKRQNLVNQIIALAIQYDLDGVNVDFEALEGAVGDGYIQFIRELSLKCANNGLVLSVDNYVPTASSSFYNRAEQARFADYVVIMGYDEHYAGSAEAGSVASINFVEEGIKQTVEQVPANKIINAVPFYTRIWSTTGTDVSSQAVGMAMAQEYIKAHNIETVWDEETCQNYGEYMDGDTYNQVWLEDAQSIGVKLNVMQNYNIGGVACWRLGYETPDIWDVIEEYLAK